MADSLEENYAVDAGILYSGPATAGPSSSSSSKTKTASSSKRPRPSSADDDAEDIDDGPAASLSTDQEMRQAAGSTTTAAQKAARKARRKAQKARKRMEAEAEAAASSSSSSPFSSNNAALLPPDMQADHLRKQLRQTKSWKSLSEIELDEVGIREADLVDTTAWKHGRELSDLANFARAYVKQVTEEIVLEKVKGQKGTPVVLFLTNNALRAATMARELRSLLPPSSASASASASRSQSTTQSASKRTKTDSSSSSSSTSPPHPSHAQPQSQSQSQSQPLQIAKLFSRHFRPAEQVSFLESHAVLAGVGTPQRVALLLGRTQGQVRGKEDPSQLAIKVDQLAAIVLDVSWRDEKQRTLLDDPWAREAVKDVWEVVGRRNGGKDVKMVLF